MSRLSRADMLRDAREQEARERDAEFSQAPPDAELVQMVKALVAADAALPGVRCLRVIRKNLVARQAEAKAALAIEAAASAARNRQFWAEFDAKFGPPRLNKPLEWIKTGS